MGMARVALLFAMLLGIGCTRPWPTKLVVSTEFSPDEQAAIVQGIESWQKAGAHLSYRVGRVNHYVTDEMPIYPEHRIAPEASGKTSEDGLQLDVQGIVANWGYEGLRMTAMHELGHVLGLGAPADEHEHVEADGDIMCPRVSCYAAGRGTLSRADLDAWQAGGAR